MPHIDTPEGEATGPAFRFGVYCRPLRLMNEICERGRTWRLRCSLTIPAKYNTIMLVLHIVHPG